MADWSVTLGPPTGAILPLTEFYRARLGSTGPDDPHRIIVARLELYAADRDLIASRTGADQTGAPLDANRKINQVEFSGWLAREVQVRTLYRVVADLAYAHRDHPDYREREWKP